MTDHVETHPDEFSLPDDRAQQLLTFEAEHPHNGRRGQKEEAIRRDLGITPARYWQLILRLADTEQALRIDPTTTHRIRRLADRSTTT